MSEVPLSLNVAALPLQGIRKRPKAWFNLHDLLCTFIRRIAPYLHNQRFELINHADRSVLIYGSQRAFRRLLAKRLFNALRALADRPERSPLRLCCANLPEQTALSLRQDAQPLFDIPLHGWELRAGHQRVRLFLPSPLPKPRLWLSWTAPGKAWLFWRIDPRFLKATPAEARLNIVISAGQRPLAAFGVRTPAGSREIETQETLIDAEIELFCDAQRWIADKTHLHAPTLHKTAPTHESWMTRSHEGVLTRIENRPLTGTRMPNVDLCIPYSACIGVQAPKEIL